MTLGPLFAGRGGADLLGVEASGAEDGGVGSGNGAGLTPTGPGADEERSGMNVLPSAGGLGGGGGADGGTGAGEDIGFGAAVGAVIKVEDGGESGGVVVGGGDGGFTVEGMSADGGVAGAGASFGVSGCFIEDGDKGAGMVSVALRSGVFGGGTGCPGIAMIFGPDEESGFAGLLGGIGAGDAPPLEGGGVEEEGGGNDEFKAMKLPLPPVWVIDATGGLGGGFDAFLPAGVCVVLGSAFFSPLCDATGVGLFLSAFGLSEEDGAGKPAPLFGGGMRAGSALFGLLSVLIDPEWPGSMNPEGGRVGGLSCLLAGSAGFFFASFSESFCLMDGPISPSFGGSNAGSFFMREATVTPDRFSFDRGWTG